jgi:hypothetical protein
VPLRESAESGDRLATLRDLRDLLALQIEACESLRDLAALSGRFQSVLEEIAKLEPKQPAGDGIDEIARRRAARRSSAAATKSRTQRTS